MQLALSVVLLVGATLMIRTMLQVDALPRGIHTENVIRFRTTLPISRYPNPASMQRFASELQNELSGQGSVQYAGAVNLLPLSGSGGTMRFHLVGAAPPQPGEFARKGWREAQYRVVHGQYFRALEIPLLAGRTHVTADRASASCEVVVNQRFAQVFSETSNVIGRRVCAMSTDNSAPVCEIVGVVGDVRHWGHELTIWPEIYYALQQISPAEAGSVREMTFVAKMRSMSPQAVQAVRSAVLRVDKFQPIYDLATLSELRMRTTARQRFVTTLLSAFAGFAVLLAGLGVYTRQSWTVSQRVQEFGIRMALGATRTRALCLITEEAGSVALTALLVGVAAATALSRVLQVLLFGVTPYEISTYIIVMTVLFFVTLLAAPIPARRASSVDPSAVLRGKTR